jgi:hypothetical protein
MLMSIVVDAKPMPYYCHGSKENSPGLRFGADGLFRITVFEDLHFGEGNKILVQTPGSQNLPLIYLALDRGVARLRRL